ncbi:MAG: macro domain-containing protein [Chromatiales bacterium]|nr:macro domain-containing protein [Chromatiales bacterium]
MLQEVSGDILLSRARAIAHGIAPHDHFSQGLALSLREAWPAMYSDFRHYCHVHNPEPGGLWAWMGADGRYIVSLFTQEKAPSTGQHPGRSSTQHVGHCLKALARWAAAEKISSLALPRLATGVGGLDWHAVRPLVQQHLGDLGIPVIVYTTFHAGEAAGEKGV